MLNGTTILALRALLVIGESPADAPFTPRVLADPLDCSPTYLGKTLSMLVRAGILDSIRGAHGGVVLKRNPSDVPLLDIVEACQGVLNADYCSGDALPHQQCAFHHVMRELHDAHVATLSRWTLADLLERPMGDVDGRPVDTCRMLHPIGTPSPIG